MVDRVWPLHKKVPFYGITPPVWSEPTKVQLTLCQSGFIAASIPLQFESQKVFESSTCTPKKQISISKEEGEPYIGAVTSSCCHKLFVMLTGYIHFTYQTLITQ